MSDAAETLLSLYESINAIPGSQKPVNEIFGLDTVEYVECRSCNKKTHKNQFVEVRLSLPDPDCMYGPPCDGFSCTEVLLLCATIQR